MTPLEVNVAWWTGVGAVGFAWLHAFWPMVVCLICVAVYLLIATGKPR